MKAFTYGQYIKCIHTLRLNAVLQIAEENSEYNLKKLNQKYAHDKLIKDILKNKKEAERFINQFLEPKEEVKAENLIRCTNSYSTKKYKSKEEALVYKLKNKEMFFLIEHQSTLDNRVQYRLLNYCIDIMQEWSRNKKQEKIYGYPIIVPVIIYTGEEKWRITKNFKEKQISNYVFERYKIDLEYNLVDINKLSKQVLLEKDTIFSHTMFMKKAENTKELMENLNIIIKTTKNKENLQEFINIISYKLDNLLEEEMKQELLENIRGRLATAG